MSEFTSLLRFYSIGIVTEAKKRDSMFIKVWPVEELPLVNGLVADIKLKKKGTATDRSGKPIDYDVEGKATIVAKWWPEGQGNRTTAPDVQPGETVIIYKYADREEYFWESRENATKLRRLEHVRYSYYNVSGNLAEEEYDDDKSYWIEWSTMDKKIHLHTSTNDGEACGYDFTFDTASGTFEIKDTLGNYQKLDSTGGTWHILGNTEVLLEAPLVHFKANQVLNEAPLVTNTGVEETASTSIANPHVNCV